ncbi:OmpA family protein, partial [Bradyrhizobium sp. 14AA]
MINLRFVLLATTALTAMQFASSASHAQSAPLVIAQAQPQETGPDGKPKQPPKEAPKGPPPAARPAAPPPAAAPTHPPAAPPPAAAP